MNTAKRPRPYLRSGVYTLKRAVQTLGSRALPSRRTALGRELRAWRDALVADLGGPDAISTQQAALVDLAVRTKLLVDSVDTYVYGLHLPEQPSRSLGQAQRPLGHRQEVVPLDHRVHRPSTWPVAGRIEPKAQFVGLGIAVPLPRHGAPDVALARVTRTG